ncbi:radical SAM protein [uncultured Desulfobacter sp.]|uniref:radical SAM protein n=1 Tax=uncultured Desulfobacter sp. TaxID=240139 RepID=UPI002AAC2D5A|nr:radical SAM protein [uncultured Desulfobacter sp.]
MPQARYIETRRQGRLKQKIKQAYDLMESCCLCPRECQVDRARDQTGVCRASNVLEISSYCPHFGEEPPLSGTQGSGTIFFTHCSLRCLFCQNHDISIQGQGQRAQTGQLASVMLALQKAGCHNINLVTPGHFLPFILEELDIAARNGLTLPLIYNSSGYERLEALKILDGIVDIYLPDFKFWDPDIAQKICNARDYPSVARQAVTEMFHQVGNLKTDSKGIAVYGLLVRHLVLPENLAGTREVVEFLSRNVSPNCRINVMSQYRPMYRARTLPELSRQVSALEYKDALNLAKRSGLSTGD